MPAEQIHSACERVIKISLAPALMAASTSSASWLAAAPSMPPYTINSQLSRSMVFVISIVVFRKPNHYNRTAPITPTLFAPADHPGRICRLAVVFSSIGGNRLDFGRARQAQQMSDAGSLPEATTTAEPGFELSP